MHQKVKRLKSYINSFSQLGAARASGRPGFLQGDCPRLSSVGMTSKEEQVEEGGSVYFLLPSSHSLREEMSMSG